MVWSGVGLEEMGSEKDISMEELRALRWIDSKRGGRTEERRGNDRREPWNCCKLTCSYCVEVVYEGRRKATSTSLQPVIVFEVMGTPSFCLGCSEQKYEKIPRHRAALTGVFLMFSRGL